MDIIIELDLKLCRQMLEVLCHMFSLRDELPVGLVIKHPWEELSTLTYEVNMSERLNTGTYLPLTFFLRFFLFFLFDKINKKF